MNQQSATTKPRGTGIRILLTLLLVLGAMVLGPVIAVYMLPTGVAAIRRSKHVKSIAITNALVGWTLIGWVVMMWWAFWSYTSGEQ